MFIWASCCLPPHCHLVPRIHYLNLVDIWFKAMQVTFLHDFIALSQSALPWIKNTAMHNYYTSDGRAIKQPIVTHHSISPHFPALLRSLLPQLSTAKTHLGQPRQILGRILHLSTKRKHDEASKLILDIKQQQDSNQQYNSKTSQDQSVRRLGPGM